MSRNARLLDADEPAPGLLRAGLAAAAGAALRRPAVAGGATAFVVALSFVAANALWYQPHPHGGAFFATRPGASGLERPLRTVAAPQPAAPQAARRDAEPLPVPAPPPDRRETTGAVPPPPEQAAGEAARAEAPAGDATVRAVQQVLGKLALYKGPVDGLSGPMTQSAIESYQRAVGLSVTGQIDTALLRHLGLEDAAAAPQDEPAAPRPRDPAAAPAPGEPTAVPRPAPRPEPRAAVAAAEPSARAAAEPAARAAAPRPTVEVASVQEPQAPRIDAPDATIVRIQAGLRAFGNDGIALDGVVGARTEAAIREFQSLFGLPVTGKPDAAVLAKMTEIGLTN